MVQLPHDSVTVVSRALFLLCILAHDSFLVNDQSKSMSAAAQFLRRRDSLLLLINLIILRVTTKRNSCNFHHRISRSFFRASYLLDMAIFELDVGYLSFFIFLLNKHVRARFYEERAKRKKMTAKLPALSPRTPSPEAKTAGSSEDDGGGLGSPLLSSRGRLRKDRRGLSPEALLTAADLSMRRKKRKKKKHHHMFDAVLLHGLAFIISC